MKQSILFILSLCFFNIKPIFSKEKSYFFKCNQYTCPPVSGKCGRDNECICAYGYKTIDNDSLGDFKCNYRMKSQTKAFLLEFLLGFGVGHLYIGNTILAIIKLVFTSLTCFIVCQFPLLKIIKRENKCPYIMQLLFGFGWVVWTIVDGILIGWYNFYKDSNGIELRKWSIN